MTKKIPLLSHTILPSGALFIARDMIKDKTFPPGTMGCHSFIMGPDSADPNIVFHKVVTTRRGKRGKARLNFDLILSQIFDVPELLPESKEDEQKAKHLISIDTGTNLNEHLISKTVNDDNTFIANVLARALFAKELDCKMYNQDHPIMKKIGLYDYKEVNLWPKKESLLYRFTKDIIHLHGDGESTYIKNTFCNEEARQKLMIELNTIETKLIVPRYEYQRKICDVLMAAVIEVQRLLSNSNIKNKKDLLKKAKNTKKVLKSQTHNLSKLIDRRLDRIVDERTLISM